MLDAARIRESFDNPDLFGPHFRGGTWDAWRVFLAALLAQPMTDEQLKLYHEHTGRTRPPSEPFAEAAAIVGRRGGKSRVLAFMAVALATLRNYESSLAPGEVCTIGVLTSTRKQARSIFNYALGLLQCVPALRAMVEREAEDMIILRNRVAIEIAPASFRWTRGYTYGAVLCDEIAFWRSEESANPDVEILRSLRPGLISIPGAVLLVASSPYAKKGALYDIYRRHYGRDDARVLVWKAPTEAMYPAVDRRIIAEAYEEDAMAARSEYGAEFREDLADFISREMIDACTMQGVREVPAAAGVSYVGGVDPAGGNGSDSMTVAITHLEADGTIVLDLAREWVPPFSPEVVVREICQLLKAYRISVVHGDAYAGGWPMDWFAAHGVRYEVNKQNKSSYYLACLPLANSHRVRLLDQRRIAWQFGGLERRTAWGGRDSVDPGRDQHDDLANAIAIAVMEAASISVVGGWVEFYRTAVTEAKARLRAALKRTGRPAPPASPLPVPEQITFDNVNGDIPPQPLEDAYLRLLAERNAKLGHDPVGRA